LKYIFTLILSDCPYLYLSPFTYIFYSPRKDNASVIKYTHPFFVVTIQKYVWKNKVNFAGFIDLFTNLAGIAGRQTMMYTYGPMLRQIIRSRPLKRFIGPSRILGRILIVQQILCRYKWLVKNHFFIYSYTFCSVFLRFRMKHSVLFNSFHTNHNNTITRLMPYRHSATLQNIVYDIFMYKYVPSYRTNMNPSLWFISGSKD
jgi:hypothetical protein